MFSIKQFMWNNPLFKWIMYLLSWIKNYLFYEIRFSVRKVLRLYKYVDGQYAQIEEFKNKHLGERCFILATGPSLTVEDVRKLKKEYTFGMNSICMLFDELGWETTYYGVQDRGVFEKLVDKYQKLQDTVLFVGDGIPDSERNKVKSIPFAINYLDHKHS